MHKKIIVNLCNFFIKKVLTFFYCCVIINIENEREVKTMKTIKSKEYYTIRVRDCQACGDVLMGSEVIDGKEYNIYLGYCGYCTYYAVEK